MRDRFCLCRLGAHSRNHTNCDRFFAAVVSQPFEHRTLIRFNGDQLDIAGTNPSGEL